MSHGGCERVLFEKNLFVHFCDLSIRFKFVVTIIVVAGLAQASDDAFRINNGSTSRRVVS